MPESILPASEYSTYPVRSILLCFDFFSFKSKIFIFSISFLINLRLRLKLFALSKDACKSIKESIFITSSRFIGCVPTIR